MTVYAKIENGELITAYNGYNDITGLADNPDISISNGFTAYTEEEIAGYYAGSQEIINGILTDISNTDSYKAKIYTQENAQKKADLQLQIDELDKKRIRAIAEPAVKDKSTGQTWLEYYTEQVKELRSQIASL